MAATRGLHYTDKFRNRIKASLLRKKLQDHALGNCDMSATQVQAARILLNKCMPDLSAVEHTGDVHHRHTRELSRDELLAIAARGGEGAIEAGRGEPEPVAVHAVHDAEVVGGAAPQGDLPAA